MTDKPSIQNYLYSGLAIGYSISVIFFNGIAVFILFFAHVLIKLEQKKDNSIKKIFYSILFDKSIWLANGLCLITFVAFNPWLFSRFQYNLYKILGWAYSLILSRRTDLLITDKYTGAFSFLKYINFDFGTPITCIIVFSILSVFLFRKCKYSNIATFGAFSYILFYAASGLHQSYLVVNAIPLGILIFSQMVVKIHYPHAKKVTQFAIIVIIIVLSAPGLSRSFFQNSINRSLNSTTLSANKFLLSMFPKGSKVLTDCNTSQIRKDKKNQYLELTVFPGSSGGLATSLNELFPPSDTFLNCQYALVGKWREILKMLSSNQFNYKHKEIESLKLSIRKLYRILDENANLLKIWPGKWEGMDHRNLHGYKFHGFGFKDIKRFYSEDHYDLAYGQTLKLYELTTEFKEKLLSEMSNKIETSINYDNESSTHNVGIKGIVLKSLRIQKRDNSYRASIKWKINERIPIVIDKLYLIFHNDNYPLENKISLNKLMTGLKGKTWIQIWQPTIIIKLDHIEGDQFVTQHYINHLDSLIDGTYSIYVGGLNNFKKNKNIISKLIIRNIS